MVHKDEKTDRVNDRVIGAMVAAVVKEVAPEKIILFGSRSDGASAPGSDVDLMVIAAEPFDKGRSRRQEITRIYRAVARFPVSKDILLYSRDEVEQWRSSVNHIIARALRDGKVLYERH